VFAVPPNTLVAPERPGLEHPVRIATRYAADRSRWRTLLRYDAENRWFALLDSTPTHEVWLLSWLPGQYNDPHDHGIAQGAFTVVSGVLTERVIRQDRTQEIRSVGAGQSRVFGPDYVHQVRNDGLDPAISVHVYRPGRAPMNFHRLDPMDLPPPI
jgi:predicted metal-dependent enzyme (double-stranded beta helix superfamily)